MLRDAKFEGLAPMNSTGEHLRRNNAYPFGLTSITSIGEEAHDTGMNFSILRLAGGEHHIVQPGLETAVMLLAGSVTFSFEGRQENAVRSSYFDEDPFALHQPSHVESKISASAESELVVLQTENSNQFETRYFTPKDLLESEHRGQGLLGDTAYRVVRTIFDKRNRPESNLVLGEVITFPGRWSSYPPHHHPQPEIYHYRFTEECGYGHGELGDNVLKIRHGDTVKILDEKDHAQTAAPGYGMMYVWAIRHLPDAPYIVPEFTAEHNWTRSPEANERVWQPFGAQR